MAQTGAAALSSSQQSGVTSDDTPLNDGKLRTICFGAKWV